MLEAHPLEQPLGPRQVNGSNHATELQEAVASTKHVSIGGATAWGHSRAHLTKILIIWPLMLWWRNEPPALY